MQAGFDGQSGLGESLAVVAGVLVELVAQYRRGTEHLQTFEGSGGDAWSNSIGKQIRAGALAQQVDDFLAAAGVAAAGAAKRLAEGAGEHVHATHDAAQLVRTGGG